MIWVRLARIEPSKFSTVDYGFIELAVGTEGTVSVCIACVKNSVIRLDGLVWPQHKKYKFKRGVSNSGLISIDKCLLDKSCALILSCFYSQVQPKTVPCV